MPPPASAYCISQQAVRLDVTLSRDAGRRGVGRKRGPEAGAAAEAEPTGGGKERDWAGGRSAAGCKRRAVLQERPWCPASSWLISATRPSPVP